MQIDWFTLLAQVVNFLVLVWLLQRFLYDRIIQAMNEREKKIAARLDEAAQKLAEATYKADHFQSKNRELDEQRDQLIAKAKDDSESQRQKWLEEARTEIDQMQTQWMEGLQQEREGLFQDFQERTGQQVLEIARRAMRDLADARLEQQMLSVFLERVRDMDPSERHAMIEAIRESDNRELEFRCAFPLAAEVREHVTQSLRELLDDDVVVRYEVEPQLSCGIELRAHSHRMVWNTEAYIDALEKSFLQGLETERGAEYVRRN